VTSPTWEELVWIGHEAYLGFADGDIEPSLYTSALQASRADGGLVDGAFADLPLVVCYTEADADVPVEVQRDAAGIIIAARMCWTDDVDELDGNGGGEWRDAGLLRIESGSCRAWDPVHAFSGYTFELRPGSYTAQTFVTEENDSLGLRIIARPVAVS
jgi:hypothetical protein